MSKQKPTCSYCGAELNGPEWWYDDRITEEPDTKCKIEDFYIYNKETDGERKFSGFSQPFIEHNWYRYKFPKRLFLLGAGPSLGILYEFCTDILPYHPDLFLQDWGKWAEMRADISHDIHTFVKPDYSIRLNPDFRKPLEEYTVGEKIIVGRPRGNSLSEFLQLFEEHGGEEIFLFGFDSDGSGYWNGMKKNVHEGKSTTHSTDFLFLNHKVLPVLSLKIHHIGETRLNVNKIMSIEDLLDNYIRG